MKPMWIEAGALSDLSMGEAEKLFRLFECMGSHEIWFTDWQTIARAGVAEQGNTNAWVIVDDLRKRGTPSC